MRQDGAKKGRTRRILRPFGRGIVLLAIALVLTTSTVVPETEFDLRLLPMLGDRRFDWISWETGTLWEEWYGNWLRVPPAKIWRFRLGKYWLFWTAKAASMSWSRRFAVSMQ